MKFMRPIVFLSRTAGDGLETPEFRDFRPGNAAPTIVEPVLVLTDRAEVVEDPDPKASSVPESASASPDDESENEKKGSFPTIPPASPLESSETSAPAARVNLLHPSTKPGKQIPPVVE